MPITPTYPGVYIEEILSQVRTITGVATSIAAFVGYTARGQINKAVRIFNIGDYERNFGGLHRDSPVSYAVRQFFLNGGTDAYVVRVAKGAAKATVTLQNTSNPVPVLHVSAANEGFWGNLVRLEVDYKTNNPDSTFNLTVSRYEERNGKLVPVETEQHRNLSMNSRSATYAPSVVGTSNLITLTRDPGITFGNRGFSLSEDLASFPVLDVNNSTITGILNGTKPFTLKLTTLPTDITDITDLVPAVNSAIQDAGLTSYLQASQANADGSGITGNHLKLTSLVVSVAGSTEKDTENEYSSVEILRAATNDLSAKLGLGLSNGGREWTGSSAQRPAPTGTSSGDLVDQMNATITDTWTVTIKDYSSSSPALITSQTTPQLTTTSLNELCKRLQESIRGINHPAARNARVELAGNYLRLVASADTPSAIIELTSSGTGAASLLLPTAAGPTLNVQQYSLGSVHTIGAQVGGNPGADGSPPDLDSEYKDGLDALRTVDLFNLLAIPGTTAINQGTMVKSVLAEAIALCEERRAFFLMDADPGKSRDDIATWVSDVGRSPNAAVFFPQIQIADPLDGSRLKPMPPSGTIAGVMARIDGERGIWKAPAGTETVLRGVQGLAYTLIDAENGMLNQEGINCLRSFPVYGNVIWGARTLMGADEQTSEWKYIPVRRLALYIEESLYRGTQWVVFEPNDEPLWAQIRLNVGAFMHNLFRQGAFAGQTPRLAYLVKCDRETTTQYDIDSGVVNILVGFAPLKPAEFVFIKISQLAGKDQA